MAKKFEAGLEIKADVKGTESVSRLADEIEAAGIDTSNLRREGAELTQQWQQLENNQKLIARFRELKLEARDVGQALEASKLKTAALAAEFNVSPSKSLEKQLQASIRETKSLTSQQESLNQKVSQTRTAMADAGISTKNLHQTLKQLQAGSEAVKGKLAELTTEAQRLKTLAAARIQLGLNIDEHARNELAATQQAFEELKRSGTLSQAELGRAAELHAQKVQMLERRLGIVSDEAKQLQRIAAAKTTLGLNVDDRARAEIQAVKQAYEDLKNSGTLSHEELGRAADLHNQKVRALEQSLGIMSEEAKQLQRIAAAKTVLGFDVDDKASKELADVHTAYATLKASGILTNSQLERATERYTAKVKALESQLGIVTEKTKRLNQLASDKAKLGLDIDERNVAEINAIQAAYERLKASGTLSSTQLARATELHRQKIRELKGEAASMPSAMNPIAESLQNIGKKAMALTGVTAGLYGVKESLSAVLRTTQEFQAVRQRLDYAFGGVEEGGKQLDFVRNISNQLGLEVLGAAKGYGSLASATKELNITQQQTQQIFSGVAHAAAAMHLSADDANGVFLALSQIAGKGKVSMEELRQQLGERLTPAMGIAAKSMGVTTAELEKMVESGISAEDFLPRFGAALEEVFAGEAAANANTLSGQINILKNQFNELLNGFGEGGIADAAIKVMQDIGESITWLETQMAGMDATVSGGIKDAFVGTYEGVKEAGLTIAHLITSIVDRINAVGQAFNTLSGNADQDFDIVKSIIDGVNITIGVLRDGIAALGIGIDLVVGTSLGGFALMAEGLSKITFGDISKNFEEAAKGLSEASDKHFGKAHNAAMNFESKAVQAADRAIESEQQRFLRLETEAKAAYQAAAQAAIEAADKAKEAQDTANAAIGTDAEETATKQAAEANKVAVAAKVAAQKAQTEWTESAKKIGASDEEIAKVIKPLQEAGLAAKTTTKELEAMSPALKAAKGAADGMGINVRAAMSEISPAVSEAKKKIDLLQTGFKDMSAGGINAGSVVSQAMAQMLEAAVNPADIEAVKQKWREFGATGAMSASQVEQGLMQAETKLQDINNTLNPVNAALQNTTAKAKELPQALIGAKAAAQTLGVDITAAMNEPSMAMLTAQRNIDKIRAGFNEMKASGMNAGAVVRGAIDEMLKAAANQSDIDLAKKKIKEFGTTGALSMRDVEQGIINANSRLQEINNTLNPVNQAFEKLGIKTKEALGNSAKDMQAAFERVKDSGKATTDGLADGFKRAADAALASGDIQSKSWVRARAETYGYKVVIDDAGKASLQLAEDVKKSNAEQQAATKSTTEALKQQAGATNGVASATKSATGTAKSYKAITWAIFDRSIINNAEAYKNMISAVREQMKYHPGGDVLAFFKEYNRYVKIYQDQTERAQKATENLNQKIEAGTVNQKDLAAAVEATNARFGKLDSTTLKNLHEAIDKARQKIKAMRDEAEDTRAGLEAELASARGDETKREALEQQSKIRELNLKLQEAEAAQNREAVGDYRNAIKLQEQIYAEKQRQAALEKERAQQQAEAERIAAEQAATQAQAEQVPIEINVGTATVPVEATAGMANQIASALKNALAGRDQGLVDAAVSQFMNQILDEMKRMGM
ncbi:tape measure protein [Vitreoscilla massiliensis]|uniref:Tape measure protein n=1 Tax=Vitreoscilla massiliensis TaxID=1689272 RepID=A0ABY4E1C0_9NEIS|nr:tape measure protein [Vitreoscilla massiliensis]UOO89589.1 tape measure protein [Vitreoscilla massiliensis]